MPHQRYGWPQYYRLVGKLVVACPDMLEWGRSFKTADHHVAFDEIGPLQVSTVFLGLDHNWGRGEPLLFETMIFGDLEDGYQVRTSTWAEAERAHADAVAFARETVARAEALLAPILPRPDAKRPA